METIEKLGKYEIKRTLGRGAMGVVYEGWDPTIQRVVAIKTVPITDSDDPETQEAIARFRREAQAAGRLTHPNIVSVFDYGETKDVAYIVMEYVNGPSLKDLMGKDERFPLPDIVKIMHDVLAGLEHSHEQGVVHRDIKPANLMLTSRDRNRARVKISDFGIARIESSSMTQAGVMMGTPTYMSPEQFMGQPVDARSDIYACGVMLYQLLTGERPFEGGLSAIMHKVLNTEPIPASQLSLTVTPAMDAVVKKAMAKRPAERFQNAHDFAQALDAAMKAPADTAGPADSESTMVAKAAAAPTDVDATMAMATMATMPPSTPPAEPAAAAAPAAPPQPPPVEATVITPPPPEKRSAVPLIAGAAVVLAAVAAGGGWFLMRPGETPAPPQVVATAPSTGVPAPQAQMTRPAEPATLPTARPAEPVPAPVQTTPPADVAPPPAQVASPAETAPAPVAPPVSTPAPTPPQKQAMVEKPPLVLPPAGPDVTAIRDRFAQIVGGQACSLLNGSVSDHGTVTLTGLAGPGVRDDIRDALAGQPVPVLWRTTPVERVFCYPLEMLRPIATPFAASEPRVGLSLADDRTALHDGERIRPRLVMPNFQGYLRVDYITHDGAVQHLYPQIKDKTGVAADTVRQLAPGELLSLGEPPPGQPVWEVGPPYGVDMIVAVASSQPLFTRSRPANVEKADLYLRDLANAIQSAQRAGAKLSGNAMVLETLPK